MIRNIIALTVALSAFEGTSFANSDSVAELKIQPIAFEHCKTFQSDKLCYLQTYNADGTQTFTATAETAEKLGLDKSIIEGINFAVVSKDQYALTQTESNAGLVDYDIDAQAVVPDSGNQVVVTYGWKCSLGSAGAMGLGGLAGMPFGPLAVVAGAISGYMVGAAASCDFDF